MSAIQTAAATHRAVAHEASDGHVLTRKRIYILPTRHGLSFCVVGIVMLIGAINYNNSLGYLLTFLLASLALVSMLHAYRNLAGLSIKVTPGDAVFCGDYARYAVVFDNRGLASRHDVCVSFVDAGANEREPLKAAHLSIAAHATAKLDLRATSTERGWHTLNRVTVSTRFPFGLFRAWSTINHDARTVVYPTPQGSLALPTAAADTGNTQGSRGQGSDDFSGLRKYTPGDPTRHIHWKSAAREQEISVKVFTSGSPAQVWLHWQDVNNPDVEVRLSQLAAWIQQSTRQALPFGLQIPGKSFPVSSTNAHRHQCLQALALYGINDD